MIQQKERQLALSVHKALELKYLAQFPALSYLLSPKVKNAPATIITKIPTIKVKATILPKGALIPPIPSMLDTG